MSKTNAILRAVVALCAGAMIAQPLFAAQSDTVKDYPNKPIRFLVPFTAGAGTDTTARTLAAKLAEAWGHQVVVDNRTGAAGTIAVDLTAKAAPDGYTICLISASNSVNAATNPKLPYDLTKDLQGITQATSLFYVLYVNPSVPAKSVKELIAYTKANPGKLHFGSSGIGGLQHFAGEMFNHLSGAKIVHVPYKGTASVVIGLFSGEVQVGFGSLVGMRTHLDSGKARGLAITAAKRSPAIPDLPTIAEAGVPGYEATIWLGVMAPAGTPPAIVDKLNAEIGKIIA
ncbi:MAG: tripartite tricarboxylate transporter substrate binding protein, partial [Burkholderiales bacterium]|nr:tripartite tricarboxylate transporter substrate binding protein [Burkholderiales bacterium]